MYRKYRGISCIFFLLISFQSFTQIRTDVPKSELDSLINIIPNFQNEALVDHLNLIATSISQRYPDSCFYYARKALELSKSLGYEFGEAEAVFNIGNGYYYKVDVKNAVMNYLTALKIFEGLKHSSHLGNVLLQIGYINSFVQNHSKAIEFYRKASLTFKDLGKDRGYINAIYFLAHEFIDAKMYDSAFHYFNLSIHQCKSLGFGQFLSKSYNGSGITYLWRDDYRPENERFEGVYAIPYFDSALLVADEINYIEFKPNYLVNLAECYHHYMNPQQRQIAEKIYYESLSAGYLVKDYSSIALTQALLGELYADEKKLCLAKVYLDSSLFTIKKFYLSIDTLVYSIANRKYTELSYMYWTKSFAYRGLYKLFKASGDFDSAMIYYQLMVKIVDSLKEQQNRNQIDYLLANAENERINQHIELLQKENELRQTRALRSIQILISLVIISVITGFILLIYLRHNKLKTEQDKTNLQQKLLRSQMNPHFIFNSLASIQNSIINEEPLKASKYLARFSKLVRNILDSSVEEFISLDEEIITIDNYLALQKIRFPEKFDYKIEIEENIDRESTLIPPMLAQPFIENSIEHGFKNKEGKGKMIIRFELKDNLIHFEVEDDGIGREKAMEFLQSQNNNHRSMSTQITKKRLGVLNKKARQKILLNIEDLKDSKGNPNGTKVTFDIPYRN